MAPRPVEAVFFFRWDLQTSQATYRRISDSSKYTKSYLQVSGRAKEALDEVFDRTADGVIPIVWHWPGDDGGQPGKLRPHKGDPPPPRRAQLSWDKSGKAPLTWKLGDPEDDPAISIPGRPDGETEQEADDALKEVTDADIRPWFVAVKLVGEENELHARAYLENPPEGLGRADIAQLPAGLLAAMKTLEGQSGVFRPVNAAAVAPAPRAPKIVEAVQAALENDPNVLLVGPPGTGKTVALEDLRAIVEATDAPLSFDPDLVDGAFGEAANAGKVVSLVFHSSYSYENFVAGLVPRAEGGALSLRAQPGPLINLGHWSAGSERRAMLILDEFNRGPTAAIFGDTLALLDGSKRSGENREGGHIARPFSDQGMEVPREYADADGVVEVPAELRLPDNLEIVAALNSSDRSVAPLDAALRRRFAIIRVDPDLELLAGHLGVKLPARKGNELPDSLQDPPDEWTDEEVSILAVSVLAALNERIEFILGDDFVLGHALFWPIGEADDPRRALCDAFDQRVVQSLRLSFTDQDDLIAATLGLATTDAASPPGVKAVASWRRPPVAIESYAQPCLNIHRVGAMDWEDAARALIGVVTESS